MEAKCYRAMQRAQGKMLREYFSVVSVESLSRRYGYSVIKIKTMASDYKQGKIDIFDDLYRPEKSLPKKNKLLWKGNEIGKCGMIREKNRTT